MRERDRERDRERGGNKKEREIGRVGREGERKQLRHSPLILCVSSQRLHLFTCPHIHQALQDLMTSVGTKAFARPISSSASDVLDVIRTVYQV